MDTQKNEQPGWQSEGESLNTGSAENTPGATPETGSGQQEEHQEKGRGGIHNNALYAAGMGRSASAQVHRHNAAGLEQTGTNPGYETPISAGAGGSVGTGFSSGRSAADPTISSDSDYDMARVGHKHTDKGSEQDAQEDPAEKRPDLPDDQVTGTL